MAQAKAKRAARVVVDQISRSIPILRGQRVILDRELAAIYGSTTKRLNEQIKRNRDRAVAGAMANVHIAQAQGRPVVQLIGSSSRSTVPVSASLGQPALPALTRENYIGLKIEIPLLGGFHCSSQIDQAEAQVDVQEQVLRDAQQQGAIGVWSAVQTLRADTENLRNTDVVVESATRTFDAAQHRYRSGCRQYLGTAGRAKYFGPFGATTNSGSIGLADGAAAISCQLGQSRNVGATVTGPTELDAAAAIKPPKWPITR